MRDKIDKCVLGARRKAPKTAFAFSETAGRVRENTKIHIWEQCRDAERLTE
ncbi:hypothetical protein GCM10011591_10850 [Nocardia camponoti]|uniref:Uncharacterized protein n=1 Tax=Nocardia camponoti TaxID=1616106 RepID=A0A917V5P1_9NOCA|nr:hypothetical protein GCM10011591_10850 [Nocardia camponoti]